MSVSLPLDPALATPAAAPTDPVELPSPLAFGRALGGYALLGVIAALGGAEGASQAPVSAVSTVGALVLTVPALLVAHPFLSLRAAPEALLGAIARPFARVGDLALGLVPTLLLFRATSGLAPLLLAAMLVGLACLGFSLAVRHLVQAERSANPDYWAVARMSMLAWAWSGLALLIGARLALGFLLNF